MKYSSQGFSVIEVILAAAIFMLFSTASVVVVLHGFNTNRLGGEETIANQFATEGIEAVRSIKNQSYSNLTVVNNAPRGVTKNVSNVWAFLGDNTNNTLFHNSSDNYIRTITIEDVQRDCAPPDGNIVVSGGQLDSNTKKVTSTVSWQASASRSNSVVLTTYLSDWRRLLPPYKGGILVYGDNSPNPDAIKYRIFDAETGTWSTPELTGDVDPSTNRVLRAARVYSSSERNEKILLSRHYDGSTQYIYGQVFNGCSWTTPQLLSSWNSTKFLDVRNFDGTYLANGNFMAIYSDNTNTPQYSIWDGSSWSAQNNTTNVGGRPNYIVARARSGTNEVMMAVFDQGKDTNTAYFNGTSWSSAIQHGGNAPANTKEHVSFVFSPENNLRGALVYSDKGNDTTLNVKIYDAGLDIWSSTANSAASGGKLGAVNIDGRKGAEEFIACQKDDDNDIYCFRSNTSPSWTSPANNILTTSDTGIQRSFDVSYEASSGTEGIAVYSDNTSTPKIKKYNASTNFFDATPTNISALGETLKTVRTMPLTDSNDIMILMADANNDLYSVVWDGGNNSLYSSPSGRAFSTHGTNGSATTEFWYDFAWDKF